MKLSTDINVFKDTHDENCFKIYNNFTNTICSIDKRIYEYLKNLSDKNDFTELYDNLSQEQIDALIESNVLILNDLKYKNKKITNQLPPLPQKIYKAYIHITFKCNLNCEYCYQKNNLNKNSDLSFENYKIILSKLKEVGCQSVVLTGGEPLLHKDIYKILEYTKSLNIEISLLTNGTMLKLKNKVIEYIDTITISLDGLKNTLRLNSNSHGILKSIKDLHEKHPDKITVRSVVSRNHEKDVMELENILKECGISHIKSMCIPNNTDELACFPDWKAFRLEDSEPINADCGAGRTIISIDTNGNIYPCQILMKEELVITNIFEPNWKNLFFESNMHEKVKSFNPYTDKVCSKCNMIHLCTGGCRGVSYQVYKDFNRRPEFICEYYKACCIKRIEDTCY